MGPFSCMQHSLSTIITCKDCSTSFVMKSSATLLVLIRSWATPYERGMLYSKRSEATQLMALDCYKLELSFLVLVQCSVVIKGFTFKESFPNHLLFFVSAHCYPTQRQSETSSYVLLHDLLDFVEANLTSGMYIGQRTSPIYEILILTEHQK